MQTQRSVWKLTVNWLAFHPDLIIRFAICIRIPDRRIISCQMTCAWASRYLLGDVNLASHLNILQARGHNFVIHFEMPSATLFRTSYENDGLAQLIRCERHLFCHLHIQAVLLNISGHGCRPRPRESQRHIEGKVLWRKEGTLYTCWTHG